MSSWLHQGRIPHRVTDTGDDRGPGPAALRARQRVLYQVFDHRSPTHGNVNHEQF